MKFQISWLEKAFQFTFISVSVLLYSCLGTVNIQDTYLLCRRVHPSSSSALLVISSKFLINLVILGLFVNGEG